jgi:uncharacterized protein YndB with AHSA1/START domain
MVAKKIPRKKPVEPKLTLTRIFAAPRALVFAAWTQPRHMKQWSAPHGFTIPVSKGDLRPGGKWRACMVSPQGEQLWLHGVYREVVPNERLVFTHTWAESDGGSGHETVLTVRFSDLGRKTKVVLTQAGFDSVESRDGHRGGWSQCLERLAELLAKLSEKKS